MTEAKAPLCEHPNGTTLGHEVPPTEMWAVKRDNKPVWYCPDCQTTIARKDGE